MPLSPSPVLSAVNETTLQVQWEAPFTWEDFPITNYTVEVFNQTNRLDEVVFNPNVFSYDITRMAPFFCGTNLTFYVLAINSVGISLPGIAQGAFPVRESMLMNWCIIMIIIIMARAWTIFGGAKEWCTVF